jgi:AraC family transcriptional regulator of adaptative response/methylated-DNA-[protein]-cysteine methyltransferase
VDRNRRGLYRRGMIAAMSPVRASAPARSPGAAKPAAPRAGGALRVLAPRLPREDEMYRAVVERDASYCGVFVVAVRTTGVFCRPGCTAKTPKRDNVAFFASARDALHAGFRACKVCRPLDAIDGGATPAWVDRLTAAVDADPDRRWRDADLRRMGIDPARARRFFQSRYGMTFHAYGRSRRLGRALGGIRASRPVDRVALAHGFESESGFREAFGRLFGAPPGEAHDVAVLHASWIDTPLGAMLALASERGLCLLEFVDRRMLETQIARIRRRFRGVIVPGASAPLRQAERELREYFDRRRRRFDVPLDQRGSAFQRRVWAELLTIPHGATTSYAAIAAAVGRPGASRAVGRANGDNPIAIIVPCHRVVRADGTLCGYGGGVWRKRRLLELEAAGASGSR